MSEKAIQDYVDSLRPDVQKEVTIVSNKETNLPYFIHISPETKPKYSPRIGHRQLDYEDRTVPRITVADTLLGCFVGYGTLLYNVMSSSVNIDTKSQDFKGGLYIYALPFEYALRPSDKLMAESKRSNEHWLVAYEDKLHDWPCERAGKFYLTRITMLPVTTSRMDTEYTFHLEVLKPFYYTESQYLAVGYYEVTQRMAVGTSYKLQRNFTIEPITKAVFMEQKRQIAANLSAINTNATSLKVLKEWK